MTDPTIPEARTYHHQKCDAETVVSGDAFEALSDPLSDMSRTWCNTCNAFFPLSDFAWSDTGETITDYYSRHSARATKIERYLCSRTALVVSAVVGFLGGAIGGFILFRDDGWVRLLVMTVFVGVIGIIACASLKEFFLGKLIIRRVCGVSDTRLLK